MKKNQNQKKLALNKVNLSILSNLDKNVLKGKGDRCSRNANSCTVGNTGTELTLIC